MVISTSSRLINSMVAWVTPSRVWQTGYPQRLRSAAAEGGNGACFQGSAHDHAPVPPIDIPAQGIDLIFGPHFGLLCSSIDIGLSTGSSWSGSAPTGIRAAWSMFAHPSTKILVLGGKGSSCLLYLSSPWPQQYFLHARSPLARTGLHIFFRTHWTFRKMTIHHFLECLVCVDYIIGIIQCTFYLIN